MSKKCNAAKYSHDVGFSIGLKHARAMSFLQDLRIGFNYNQTDQDGEGFIVNTGYTF